MKKLIIFVLALACMMALCSCGWNSQKAVATVFSENVTKVDITHRIGTETTNWSIEGAGIADLKEWFDNLNYKHIEVKDGQSPGDSNGNEVYTFAFTGGEWLGFSYVINGENDCYILNPEGNWFAVTNPSVPPITEVYSFHAKVLAVHDKYMLVEHLSDGKTLPADKIEVPLEEKTSWPIPAVGDNVEVYYDGTIMETYPARLSNVYRVEILTNKLTTDIAIPKLNLQILKDLVKQHGENLTWSHFDSYYCEEVTSGLYTLCYPVDTDYHLLIIGDTEKAPTAIMLTSGPSDYIIDIRTNSIDDFIDGT